MRIAARGQERKENKSIFLITSQGDTLCFSSDARAFDGGADGSDFQLAPPACFLPDKRE
jgi:hypothetical protein